MKKAIILLILLSVALTASACTEQLSSGKEGFLSPSVIFDGFDKARDDFLSVAVAPQSDSTLSGKIEWEPPAEAADTVYPNAEITGSYVKEGGVFAASVMTTSGMLDVYKDGSGLIIDKTDMNVRTSLPEIFSKYLDLFCKKTEDGDYVTLPDNIRVSDVDEEVARITLTLPKDRAAEAIRAVADGFGSDAVSYNYVEALVSLFAETYGTAKNGRQLLESVILSSLYKAADEISGDLVWVRYVKNGKTVSERLTVPTDADNYDIYYTCTAYDKETEIKFFIMENTTTALCNLYALFRRGDLSDTYRIQADLGGTDYILTLTGEVKKAYKSGSADIKLYFSGEKSENQGSMRLCLSYDATRGLKYAGEGGVALNGRSNGFTVSFGFTPAANVTPPEKPPVMVYATEFYSTLKSKVGTSFPDVIEFLTGEEQ